MCSNDAVEKEHLSCMILSKYFHFRTLNKINLDLYKNARRWKKLKNLRNLNLDLYYRIFGWKSDIFFPNFFWLNRGKTRSQYKWPKSSYWTFYHLPSRVKSPRTHSVIWLINCTMFSQYMKSLSVVWDQLSKMWLLQKCGG